MISASATTMRHARAALRAPRRIYRSASGAMWARHPEPPILAVNAWVAERLLAAETPVDLDEAIADLVGGAELERRLTALSVEDIMLPASIGARRWEQVLDAFRCAPDVLQGVQEFALVAACLAPALDALRAEGTADQPSPSGDPLAFAYDPTIPSAVAEAVYDGMCSGVALMAMEHVAMNERDIPHWQRHALVERWVPLQHHYLRLLASIPENRVPEGMVPRAERYDLDALEAENTSANAWLSNAGDAFAALSPHARG